MSRDQILAIVVTVLGATGTFLLLPHKHGAAKPRNAHAAGAVLDALALVAFLFFLTPPGGSSPVEGLVARAFFYAFVAGTLCGGVLTVTSRDPTHSALWFAAVVLSTCGLFLQAGAAFLAVGTVIVYAGAIIVTFLFVIMLAQMEGRAAYDRAARTPFRATFTCFILLLGVLWSVLQTGRDAGAVGTPAVAGPPAVADGRLPRAGVPVVPLSTVVNAGVAEVLARAVRPTARLTDADGLVKPHVAGLGETLYTDHLMVVELTGALLFAALIGALAIATPKPPVRARTETRGSADVKASTGAPTTVNV